MTAPILAFDSLDSSNAEARRRAEAGERGPLWITSKAQTAGKGRRGRSWVTLAGNLAATLLFSTERKPAEAAQVSFVAALAVADMARCYVPPAKVALKWPNDVMVGGLKVCGILVESGSAAAGGLWMAVGIGVNLAQAPEGTERPAAALADFMDKAPPVPGDALETLARCFADRLAQWDAGGFDPVRRDWTDMAQGLGARCVVRLELETIEGVAEGLDADGALRLRLPDGQVRLVTAGDVFFPGVG